MTAFSSILKNETSSVFIMCFLAALFCNILNNQPMTILFTKIMLSSDFILSSSVKQASMYALIMGSNFGANFTVIGALAGIMWKSILSHKSMFELCFFANRSSDISMTYLTFAKYGFIIMPLVVAAACLVYSIELAIIGV